MLTSAHFTAAVYSYALPIDEEAAAEIWESAFKRNAAANESEKNC